MKKALLVFLLLFIPFLKIQSSTLETVPIDSWVYSAIDELHAQGFFEKLHKDIKPYSRGEIAQGLIKIQDDVNDQKIILTESQAGLLEKLNKEFKEDINSLKEENKKNTFKFGTKPKLFFYSEEKKDGKFRGQLQGYLTLQIKDRFIVKENGVVDSKAEKEARIGGNKWKSGLIGISDQAYLGFNLKYLKLFWGRDFIQWGPVPSDGLLFSGISPAFDLFKLEGEIGAFKLLWFATKLDTMYLEEVNNYANRFLSAHKVNVKLKNIELGWGEVILWGGVNRGWELYYLNPILPYYAEQYNSNRDDNSLWNFDFNLNLLKNTEFYGEFLVDDFQYDFKSEPHELGFRIGLNWVQLLKFENSFFNLEYAQIRNWVYGQNKPWNRFTYKKVGMGSFLGPDGDSLSLKFLYHWTKGIETQNSFYYRRKGEGKIEAPQPNAVPYTKFPSGIVEKKIGANFVFSLQPHPYLQFKMNLGYENIENFENIEKKKKENFFFEAFLSYHFWKEFSL